MTVPQVNHAAPICDHFCRCTNCKPSQVGERSSSLMRVRVATAGMFVAALCLIAARATGVTPATPVPRVENVDAR
ncbi:hypothetical protein C8J45_103329 [Sphingomonas sp. PP-CE-3G-477]|uniref:hypothetical protein n=1 Tax=Sphingomonas sp. PP-CE-3G-477 TaxID=2135660 RepID=UPI000D39435E|nr:hypothetical protein [Sphingomonas sp. PP-CE-3G-477]PTQ64479.1 hypothetical protein C8J45_103329 [Sphingomonas sp. PP-CE-3G-477]